MTSKQWKPHAISGLDLAFAVDVSHLMPDYKDIPDEFKRLNNRWCKVFSDFFYVGAKNIKLSPKDGIDGPMAFRHVRAIMCSFEPKHEHKEAACAFLMAEWFNDITYETKR